MSVDVYPPVATPRRLHKSRLDQAVVHVLRLIVLMLLLTITIVPVVWGFSLAFRSNQEIVRMHGLSVHTFLPQTPTMMNYLKLFTMVDIPRVFMLTLFVSLSVTALNLAINALAAYAFAKIKFPGRDVIFSIILATLAIPVEILIIPLYRQIYQMGMMNSLVSLIIPFSASAFGIFFMRQFFLGIPKELEEAAYMDGCSRVSIFLKIMLPLSKAALITLGLQIFLQQWDSFLVPVTFISSKSKMLLQVAVNYIYSGLYFNDFGVLYAGMLIATIPIIFVFLFLQKYYVAGITSTGIKG